MSKENKKAAPGKYDSYSSQGSAPGSRRGPKDKPQKFSETLIRFIKFMKPEWGRLIFAAICCILGALMYTIGPTLLGNVADAVQIQVESKLAGGTADLSPVLKELFLIFGVYAVYGLMMFLQWFNMASIVPNVVQSLRKSINDKLSRLPLRFFDANSRGDIMSRVINDTDNINQHLQGNILQTVSSVVTFFGMLIAMFVVSWKMTLVTLSVIPIGFLLGSIFARLSQKFFRVQWKKTGELNGHIEEMFMGHDIVKAFGHEKKAIAEFDEINDELFDYSRKAQWLSGIVMPVFNFMNNIGYILICVVGCIMVLEKKITIGTVLTFVAYSKLFTQPIADMAGIINNIQSNLASAERIFNVLDENEESYEEETGFYKDVKGLVEFENVRFSYFPEKPLIENFNITAKPGELVAIVGHTGAGKTTIVNLLMRFYEVLDGSIKVDGTDIRDITRNSVRKIFGMVLQDTWLFNGTIKENIAYGKDGATDEEIITAAKSACVHDFIESLPDGYDTVIDEDGSNVSQGQKQLITIARTILSDPAVLILDEATSSVDTRTEKTVQAAMNTLMKDRTSFVIAHRLSTVRGADKIIVMENGAIAESGSHEELLSQKGIYYELYTTQYAGIE